MPCNADDATETTRLAEDEGPAEQSELIALEVCPVSAVPAARPAPLVWPEVCAHSTD